MREKENVPVAAITEKSVGFKKKISFWLRANLFIPDARIGWVPYAVALGKKILKIHDVDLIFSSSPPPSAHLVAKILSKLSGLKWIADFRDPWTGIHYFEDYNRFFISKKLDEYLEKSVLKNANGVTSVSFLDIKEDYEKKVPGRTKYFYIPNGYDEEDYKNYLQNHKNKSNDHFIISHVGTIGKERTPIQFFKAIKTLSEKKFIDESNFSIVFIGKIETSVIVMYKKFKIEKYIKLVPYIPHNEVAKVFLETSALLLLISNSKYSRRILPGKTFEYLRTNKPLIVFGPENGEVAKILKETKSGEIIDYEDYEKTCNHLKKLIENYRENKTIEYRTNSCLESYERKELTKKLVSVFNSYT